MRILDLTVCLNAGDTTADALRSVNVEARSTSEHIVVESCSLDGIAAVACRRRECLSEAFAPVRQAIAAAMPRRWWFWGRIPDEVHKGVETSPESGPRP